MPENHGDQTYLREDDPEEIFELEVSLPLLEVLGVVIVTRDDLLMYRFPQPLQIIADTVRTQRPEVRATVPEVEQRLIVQIRAYFLQNVQREV